MLRPLNVTWPQFGALAQLSQKDLLTQRELAERLEADTTTVMVLCDSLEKKGWLNRVKDPSDRRVNRLILTEEGKMVFASAYPVMLSGYQLFAGSISTEDLEVVMPILGELYDNINEHYRGRMKS